MLCVCTWRGPVPMLHNHASLADTAHRQQHSRTCHNAVSFSSDETGETDEPGETDWHWHFALWSDIGGTRCGDTQPLAAEADGFVWSSGVRMAAMQAQELSQAAFCRSQAAWIVGELLPQHAVVPPAAQRNAPSSFLATLRAESPLVAVIGVSLI